MYGEKFGRNPLTEAQQRKVRQAVFAIVGLGGTGGFILENLLRMGAENFIVFDHDRFELSNFNRQALATDEFLDQPKVHAAVARAKAINKNIKISAFDRFEETSPLAGVSLALDGTDNIQSKLAIAKAARNENIPFVFSSAEGSRGIVTVFTTYKFEKAFQLPRDPEALARYGACSSIICPAASLAGTLAASQAVNYLIKKPYAKAPEAVFFDLFRKETFWRSRLG
ncbi:MAG: ThiF family adenylyltransferase [Candidatus Micrarchaeota archaeon]